MSADCEEPICIKTDPFGTYKKYLDKGKAQVFFTENENTSGNSSSSKESQSQSGQSDNSNNKKSEPEEETQEAKKPKSLEIDDYHACPNTRESLGFFTWNFLHTMAVYYPPTPTDDQKNKMRNFITGFAEFYPCKVCAHHFRNDIKKMPPEVEGPKDLSIWFCKQHNIVNKWFGKQEFDCSYENLLKRWKTGYEHCEDDSVLR